MDLMEREEIVYDFNYDWCELNEERELESSKIKIEIRKPINIDEVEDENVPIVVREDNDEEEVELIAEGEENVIDDSLMEVD